MTGCYPFHPIHAVRSLLDPQNSDQTIITAKAARNGERVRELRLKVSSLAALYQLDQLFGSVQRHCSTGENALCRILRSIVDCQKNCQKKYVKVKSDIGEFYLINKNGYFWITVA
jgi:hypothetical protein